MACCCKNGRSKNCKHQLKISITHYCPGKRPQKQTIVIEPGGKRRIWGKIEPSSLVDYLPRLIE